jgi:hypothetical protein
MSREDYPIILNNKKFIKIKSLRNKIAKKIYPLKNLVFSDKEIIRNIKNEKISVISKK